MHITIAGLVTPVGQRYPCTFDMAAESSLQCNTCQMSACTHCEEFLEGKSFEKPRDYLEFALRLLRLAEAGDFTLSESTCKLEELFNPEWPADIVEHNLHCASCGRKFQLFADTFRGHAGWGLTGPPTAVPELEQAASS